MNETRRRHNSLGNGYENDNSSNEESGDELVDVEDRHKKFCQSDKKKEQSLLNYCNHCSLYHLIIITITIIILALCCIALSPLYYFVMSEKYEENVYALLEIKKNFPKQDTSLWNILLSAIITVSDSASTCPRVILVLHQGTEETKKVSDCLISKVAEASPRLLPFSTSKPLFLEDRHLSCDGCIEHQRKEEKDRGLVVIQNLETFSSKAAAALHFFCDEYETGFSKSLYILSMRVNNNEKHATMAAELTFKSLWSEQLKEGQLDPLITRLTSQVIFVKPEDDFPKEYCS